MSLDCADPGPEPAITQHRLVQHQMPCGLYLAGFDFSIREDTEMQVQEQPGLFLGLMLSGRSTRMRVNDTGEFHIPVGCPTVIHFSEPTDCWNFYKAGDHCASVGLRVLPEFLAARNGRAGDAELAPLRALLDSPTDADVMDPCPDLSRLAEEVISHSGAADGASLRLEGLAYMLLDGFCRLLATPGRRSACGDLSPAEWQRVKMITEHLTDSVEETPSLGELARMAGINQTTLSDHFKAVHGETIFSYLRNTRLDTARRILRCERVPVTETALRVGFSSPTAFATAYRRRFGHPPSRETGKELDAQ